jgi:uncharacterized protein (DUF4415 family)
MRYKEKRQQIRENIPQKAEGVRGEETILLMVNGKPQLIVVPGEEEDAAITAAALSDPDAQPLTDEELDQFRPARRRGRPAKEVPKVPTTIRLDIEVLDSFKNLGGGWQTRINNVLLEYLVDNQLIMYRFKVVIGDYECLVLARDSIQARDKMKQHLRETGRSARGRIVVDLAFGAAKELPLVA